MQSRLANNDSGMQMMMTSTAASLLSNIVHRRGSLIAMLLISVETHGGARSASRRSSCRLRSRSVGAAVRSQTARSKRSAA